MPAGIGFLGSGYIKNTTPQTAVRKECAYIIVRVIFPWRTHSFTVRYIRTHVSCRLRTYNFTAEIGVIIIVIIIVRFARALRNRLIIIQYYPPDHCNCCGCCGCHYTDLQSILCRDYILYENAHIHALSVDKVVLKIKADV